jgi:hypothetical protein
MRTRVGGPLRRLDWLLGPYAAQLPIALVFAVEHVAGGYIRSPFASSLSAWHTIR